MLAKSSKRAAICTVVEATGSTPRKPGAKMIVVESKDPLGDIRGTIGGGAIEHLIRKEALLALQNGQPKLVDASLKVDLGMCCGGSMKVFIEPMAKRPSLILFGAGHIHQALCSLACQLGFIVTVVDQRQGLLDKDAFLQAQRLCSCLPDDGLESLPFSKDAYVVVATHDHVLDQMIIEGILRHAFKYGALVGSKRKALMTKKRLLAKGFTDQDISRVVCPAGVDICATTPEEIALSIAAQMILVKNEKAKDCGFNSSRGQELATRPS